ncbi:hypothetical protein KDW_43760 [Dictyobacter vulcani]|uniref:Orc1-like AAA ATPase domain-containing protein n=2 Tax=Dictyobacter vulcani TaxID=2607529 RepID=A0A5J4KLA6_9CHLR|nr:hypothetical protein KDW_43760 [Dictyobacter vulcani]
MDAIQFGKWMSERRRKRGWSSQRALVEVVQQDPLFKDTHISEDFLARLEAGRLAYPFRRNVRQQLFVLAWFLCTTPREVQTYLHTASLRELSPEENVLVQRLYAHVSGAAAPKIELLPVRPQHLVGREALIQQMLDQLGSMPAGLYALTGMPGVGKSALAAELVHRLAADSQRRLFQNGIITLSCKGRQGTAGLLTVLNELMTILSSPEENGSRSRSQAAVFSDRGVHDDKALISLFQQMDSNLAYMVDRLRMLLLDKNMLFLLDDVDPQFPLREALDALLASTPDKVQVGQRIVLTTSRYIPAPALVSLHQHVQPLLHADACMLLELLISSDTHNFVVLSEEDRQEALGKICTALGYLPLAIELAANALAVRGIPLKLLAANICIDPLHRLLDDAGILATLFEQAFSNVQQEQRERFALLSLLGPQVFSLECAAALSTTSWREEKNEQMDPLSLFASAYATSRSTDTSEGYMVSTTRPLEQQSVDSTYVAFETLTNTALELGYFVNSSLLERTSDTTTGDNPQYLLHPLLYAYAHVYLQRLERKRIELAWYNTQAYAEAYLERYQGNIVMLERECGVLLEVFARACQEQRHERVMHWAAKLAIITARMHDAGIAIRLLQAGIQASSQLENQYQQAFLSIHLGHLYCSQGRIDKARLCWEECLQIAQALGHPAYLWRPYLFLAHLEYIQGNLAAARAHVDTFLLRTRESGDLRSLALAYFKRGLYGRELGELETAYNDVYAALSLLGMLKNDPSFADQLLEAEAQAELARISGDYASSQECTTQAWNLGLQVSDAYTRAILLFVQARFALHSGHPQEAAGLASHILKQAPTAMHLHKQVTNLT